jgi:hypothetical protein
MMNLTDKPITIVGELNGSSRIASVDERLFREMGIIPCMENTQPGIFSHPIVPEGQSLESDPPKDFVYSNLETSGQKIEKEESVSPNPEPSDRMPDLKGLSIHEALLRMAMYDVEVRVEGRGVVMEQEPRPDRRIETGTVCRLIGRQAEWLALEDAWARRATALVIGEAGMGKTRIVGDFAASRRGVQTVTARPTVTKLPTAPIRWIQPVRLL